MSGQTEGHSKLSRDVEAVRIPSGDHITLPEGTAVIVTQALGGTFTVVVANQAGLYRIQGSDADALGRTVNAPPDESREGPFEEEQVWEQLRNCYDPEIPVNIVDLGLVYSLETTEEGNARHVTVKMTLTAPGCGMGPSIAADAEQRILSIPGVEGASVELVWDPPWSPERISPEGKEKLGMV